jgi:WLM domain
MSDSLSLPTVFNTVMSSLRSQFSGKYPLVEVKSSVDGQLYLVRDMPDKQRAADLLARVRAKILSLYTTITERYPSKPQVALWIKNFKPDPRRFLEATPDAEHTSYSVNKGEKIHLCLRQREGHNETLVSENVMMFVALHEMAHTITSSVGHGPDFWNNFGWLLKEAEKAGVYQFENFSAHPVSYCGVKITDSPTYDPEKDKEKSGTDMSIGGIF